MSKSSGELAEGQNIRWGELDRAALDEQLDRLVQEAKRRQECSTDQRLTPDPDDPAVQEAHVNFNLCLERCAYLDLLADGGRPSHTPDDDFNILRKGGPNQEIISYWTRPTSDGMSILQEQWGCWQEFRKAQEHSRATYENSTEFERYVEIIRRYQTNNGLPGGIELRWNRVEQDQLNDWREFRYYENVKADGLAKMIKGIEQAIERSELCLQAALKGDVPEGKTVVGQIDWYQNQYIPQKKSERFIWGRQLEKHAIYLKWIDEQLAILEADARPNISAGKRKRSTDEADGSEIRSKASKTSHADAATEKTINTSHANPTTDTARFATSLRSAKSVSTSSAVINEPRMTRSLTRKRNQAKAANMLSNSKKQTLEPPVLQGQRPTGDKRANRVGKRTATASKPKRQLRKLGKKS